MSNITTAITDAWDDLYDFAVATYGSGSGHSPEYDILQGTSFIGGLKFPVIAIEYTGYTMDGRTARAIVINFNVWTMLEGDEVTERECVVAHCGIVDAFNTHLKSENASPTLQAQHGHVTEQTPFEIEFEGAGFIRVARNSIQVKAIISDMD